MAKEIRTAEKIKPEKNYRQEEFANGLHLLFPQEEEEHGISLVWEESSGKLIFIVLSEVARAQYVLSRSCDTVKLPKRDKTENAALADIYFLKN